MKMVAFTTPIFRQLNKDNPHIHHDALEFPDGNMVLLTDVLEDQEATPSSFRYNPRPQPR
jgi:hypothetical protein